MDRRKRDASNILKKANKRKFIGSDDLDLLIRMAIISGKSKEDVMSKLQKYKIRVIKNVTADNNAEFFIKHLSPYEAYSLILKGKTNTELYYRVMDDPRLWKKLQHEFGTEVRPRNKHYPSYDPKGRHPYDKIDPKDPKGPKDPKDIKEMFVHQNLRPNSFLNIKGKGKKYVQNIDYQGNNPDNPFKHVALFITSSPSSDDGQWVSVNDAESEPIQQVNKIPHSNDQDFTSGDDNRNNINKANKMSLIKIMKEVKSGKISGALKKWSDEAKKIAKEVSDIAFNKMTPKQQSVHYDAAAKRAKDKKATKHTRMGNRKDDNLNESIEINDVDKKLDKLHKELSKELGGDRFFKNMISSNDKDRGATTGHAYTKLINFLVKKYKLNDFYAFEDFWTPQSLGGGPTYNETYIDYADNIAQSMNPKKVEKISDFGLDLGKNLICKYYKTKNFKLVIAKSLDEYPVTIILVNKNTIHQDDEDRNYGLRHYEDNA